MISPAWLLTNEEDRAKWLALEAQIADAKKRFEALSPEQQRAERQAQRKSWVIGNMMLDHPEMSRARAERVYDSIEEER